MELVSSEALLEWFANHYKDFGATLEIVTDRSQEGNQFVKGFGGIGGLVICLNKIQIIVCIIVYVALNKKLQILKMKQNLCE